MSTRQKKLPIEALERIDDRCAAFEARWQSDERPTIESMLSDEVPDDERDVLFAELIALDVDYRRRGGDEVAKDDYVERFPEYESAIAEAIAEAKPSGSFVPPSIDRLAALFPSLEILELLGAGGMGAVYKARQEGLDRVVALKVLPDELSHDMKFALRFTREARTLAKLNHPNIVAVYEFGDVEGTYYFLMEFVDGATLRDVVRGGHLTPEHALAFVPSLCDALQFAHDKGVVHRDIKPENILLATDGAVKIADFGLSRIVGSDNPATALTGTHQVMGTLRYMAPEQMEGARGVDHRADIYSLGVVIYEMLTGELPIGRFAPPSKKVEVDVRLDDVVLRTLEKEPRRRYQRASEVKSDVESITSTDLSAVGRTVIRDAEQFSSGASVRTDSMRSDSVRSDVEQQELVGRLLLTRRQLMDRVASALRPLSRWQVIQILVGVGLIVLGAACWAPNTHVPHRLVSGLLIHVYGVMLIIGAVNVLVRIKRVDYSKPVGEVREKLDDVRKIYVRFGPLIGFPWWLLWLPGAVTLGADVVMHPNCLWPSLVVGVVGLAVSGWLYVRAMRSERAKAEKWRSDYASPSISAADLALREIEEARIE